MQWNDATLLLTTGAGLILFNQELGDTYVNDPQQCSGLDQAPIRSNVDQRPQTHGGIIHPSFYDARHITLTGTLLVRNGTSEAAQIAGRQLLEDNLIVALDSILNTDGTLSWSGRSLTVRCDIPVTYTGAFLKNYQFGLVAADPTIT
jgi:hypothetical protein